MAGTSERLLAAVLSLVDDAVLVVDQDATIIVATPATERQFGWSPAALLGRPLDRVLDLPAGTRPPDGPARARCADGQLVAAHLRSAAVEVPGERGFRIAVLRRAGPPALRVVAGALHLVGLDRVRAALGARWPEVEARVFEAAECLIRRGLGPDDVVTRGGDGFLVRFATPDEAEAAARADALCREIARHLMGERATEEARATSFVASVSLDAAEAAGGEAALAAALDEKLRAARADLRGQAGAWLAAASVRARVVREPVFSIAGKRADLALARIEDGSAGRLARLLHGRRDEDLALALEHVELGVRATLAAIESGPAPGPLLLPVPVPCLLHGNGLERVSAILEAAAAPVRGQLALELQGLAEPSGARLAELVQAVGRSCRGAAMELPSADMLPRVRPCLARLVAVTIEADVLPPSQARRLVQMLDPAGVPLLVKNVDRDEALVALYEAGPGLLLTGRALAGGDPGR